MLVIAGGILIAAIVLGAVRNAGKIALVLLFFYGLGSFLRLVGG